MAICSCCGNGYNKSFQVVAFGKKYDFDCLECAIHILAPVCQSCGCRILGHGLEVDASFFCCRHCLQMSLSNANAKLPSSINMPEQSE